MEKELVTRKYLERLIELFDHSYDQSDLRGQTLLQHLRGYLDVLRDVLEENKEVD